MVNITCCGPIINSSTRKLSDNRFLVFKRIEPPLSNFAVHAEISLEYNALIELVPGGTDNS